MIGGARRLLVGCLAGALLCASPAAAQAPPPAWRLALADTLERSLRQLLDAWYPRAIDREEGGFLSQFDDRWQPTGAQEKMIVTQARHVWTNARAARFLADTSFLANARRGFPFLRDVMWDRPYGGFFWLVTRDGRPVPERDGHLIKQAYGIAFGIYAASTWYDVSRDTSALHLAQRAFRWLDRHAHDPVYGGYFNYMERDGRPLRVGYASTPHRPGIPPTPPKDQNSSIHILEALTELYRVWPDTTVRDRLSEMLSLIRDRIREDPGTLRQFSLADWTPVSFQDSSEAIRRANYFLDHVSFGHDVETAYLMLEASRTLGLQNDTVTLHAAKQMVDHALRTGFDTAVGGFYDRGYYLKDRPGLTIVQDTKNWWAQAEGLNTLLLMADRFPDDPLRYGEKFRKQWSYIDTFLIDHERGGWYEGGLDREPQRRTGLKGHIWKAAYHDSRALMNVIARLRAPEPGTEPGAAPAARAEPR